MTKKQLIEKMAESENGLTKAAAGRLLDLVLKTIVETVADGGSVTFVDFGSFTAAETPEHQGINPATGKMMSIPASKRVRFHAGTGFKKAVNAD